MAHVKSYIESRYTYPRRYRVLSLLSISLDILRLSCNIQLLDKTFIARVFVFLVTVSFSGN